MFLVENFVCNSLLIFKPVYNKRDALIGREVFVVEDKNDKKIMSEAEKMASFEITDQTLSSYQKVGIDPSGMEKNLYAQIRNMKNLAPFQGGNPWKNVHSTPDVFVLQGNYIKDLEDQYNRTISYNSYKPSYADMHNDQIRCYITWRTNLRKGVVYKVSLSYVVLYIFEMINNIGVIDPEDGFAKLAFLWHKYRNEDIRIDRYLVRWLKDYYLCNEFSESFSVLVEKYELQKFYPETSNTYEDGYLSPADLRKVSNYKVEESNLWRGDALLLFDTCLSSVMKNLEILLDLYGLRLPDILACKISGKNFWSPFDHAVYLDVPPPDKKVYINPVEFYECVDGVWSFYHPSEQNDATSAFVGYIVKRIAAQLRILKNEVGELPDRLSLQSLIQQVGDPDIAAAVNAVIGDPIFDEVIDTSTAECFRCYDVHTRTISGSMPVPAVLKIMEMAESEPYCRIREIRRLAMIETCKKEKAFQFFEQAKALADLEVGVEGQSMTQEYGNLQGDISGVSADSLTNVARKDISSKNSSDIQSSKNKMVVYTHMNNPQLYDYFSWRTAFRARKFPEFCENWILLYMCELIHRIGVESTIDAVSKMKDILLQYGKAAKRLEKITVLAIRDFYIYNDFDCSFVDLVQTMKLETYFPYICIAEKRYTEAFQIFSGISNYKIRKSKFYTEETASLVEKCFSHVVRQVVRYFETQGLDFYQVILGVPVGIHSLQLFKSFDLYYETKRPVGEIALCTGETYKYTSAVGWTCSGAFQGNPAAPGIVGYMMKRMEAAMRKSFKYKNKLQPDVFTTVYNMSDSSVSMKKVEEILLDPQFDRTIDQAVYYFFETEHPEVFRGQDLDSKETNRTPVVVKIDEGLLDHIREKADENLKKLLIADEGESRGEDAGRVDESKVLTDSGSDDLAALLVEGEVQPEAGETPVTVNNEEHFRKDYKKEDESAFQKPSSKQTDIADRIAPEWIKFSAALSEPAKQALRIVAENDRTEKRLFALAAQCHIMVEVLIETINEQAIEYIGDMMIENNGEKFLIYDDYIEDVITVLNGV